MTAADPPRRFRHLPLAELAGRRVPIAVTRRSRLLGLALLRSERAGAGLLIPRCRGVHTLGMRFALDLVFLGAGAVPVSVRRSVRPGRFVVEPRAKAVLEIPATESGA